MSLKVCYFGTYRANYERNRLLINGLRANGVEVFECHSPLWHSVEDRVNQASGGWKKPAFWWRVATAYGRLLWRYKNAPDFDVMVIGYPGQFDSYIGRILSFISRKPFVLDILMSLHLIAEERGLTKKSPLTGKLIFLLEKYGLKQPDLLIADTPEYLEYYQNKYSLHNKHFRLIPLGFEETYFYPRPEIQPIDDGQLHLIYYGTFIPLHGVETMIRAIQLLENRQIGHYTGVTFNLYGEGQEEEKNRQLASDLGLTNVLFHGWVQKELLPEKIAQSHICFGVFGTTKQARCTIQNKIWECMAMMKPIITGDAQTIQKELQNREQVILVKRSNPHALAEAIIELATQPELQTKIATNALVRVQQNTTKSIGSKFRSVLNEVVNEKI